MDLLCTYLLLLWQCIVSDYLLKNAVVYLITGLNLPEFYSGQLGFKVHIQSTRLSWAHTLVINCAIWDRRLVLSIDPVRG